jgi:predicted nucleic acid-binding protein
MPSMKRHLLDTTILIGHWRRRQRGSLKGKTQRDAVAWAKELIDLYETDAILTPVQIEMLAGVRNSDELKLARAFLGQFRCLDAGTITAADWEEAERLAQRVPRDGRPRSLGDCLIRAVANRLRHEVVTTDTGFPR